MLRLTLFGEFSAAGADGRKIAIKSKKAKGLLAYLALSPRMSRSREEIMALLWSDRAEAQARASLRQVLAGLRKDLGEVASETLIVTKDAIALDQDEITLAPAERNEELLAGFHLRDPAFDDWLRDERLRHEDEAVSDRKSPELPLPDKPSIAVLPFINLSADPDQEYFSDGITEEIITDLTRFRQLFVIARNSSFAYKDRAVKVQEIGRDLGVQYVVEGSVRKAGSRVRVAAERYDRDLDDIFAVQDDLAQHIVATLVGRIDEAVITRAKRKPTDRMNAYELYLRGKVMRYGEYTVEVNEQARRLFENAIEVDPQFAQAYAALADTYITDTLAGWSDEDTRDLAFMYAKRGVSLDSNDARTRSVLGWMLIELSRWEEAEEQFEKALALNPNDADNKAWAGNAFTCLGRSQEGLELVREAMRLNPLHPDVYWLILADVAFFARDYELTVRAHRQLQHPTVLSFAIAAAAHAQLSRQQDASTEFEAFLATFDAAEDESERLSMASNYALKFVRTLRDSRDRQHYLRALRKVGLPG
jgi:TolB-like protein/Tfp pilus assembly protein PilF